MSALFQDSRVSHDCARPVRWRHAASRKNLRETGNRFSSRVVSSGRAGGGEQTRQRGNPGFYVFLFVVVVVDGRGKVLSESLTFATIRELKGW